MLVREQDVVAILKLGEHRAPHEACGVLFEGTIFELENHSHEAEDSFAISVMEIGDVVGPHCNLDQVIVWHTHPSGFVGPSKGDLQSRIEGVHYLVVSLPNGEAVRY